MDGARELSPELVKTANLVMINAPGKRAFAVGLTAIMSDMDV